MNFLNSTLTLIFLVFYLFGIVEANGQCSGTITLNTQAEVDAFITNCSGNATISGNLTIGGTGSDISDISGLTFINHITNSLVITKNSNLITLSGLDNLKTIGSNFFLRENTNLIGIEELNSLESINWNFWIIGNLNLKSLAGIDKLTSIGFAPKIYDNPELSVCHDQSICSYLFNFGGGLEVHDNKAGCNSVFEIQEGCESPINLTLCNKAQTVTCGQIFEGNSSNLADDIQEICNVGFSIPELVFKINFTENKRFDLFIDYPIAPFIYYLNSCNPTNCVILVHDDRISFTNTGIGEKYFAIGFPPVSGSDFYSVLFMCDYEPGGDACANAIPLTCGETYNGNSTSAVNKWRWENVSCPNGGVSPANINLTKDITHKFTLTTESTVSIKFSYDKGPSNQFSATAFVYGQCNVTNASSPTCLENHLSLNNPMVLEDLLPGTYYVVVETNDATDYSLGISCSSTGCDAFSAILSGSVTNNQNIKVETTINSTTMISNSANVVYEAGTSIMLSPDFQVENGCTFHALIADCTNSLQEPESIAIEREVRELVSSVSLSNLEIFPNPFNHQTSIQFNLPQDQIIQINLYNLNGVMVKSVLPMGGFTKGQHKITLQIDELPSGIYYLNWQTETGFGMEKLVIQR